MRDARREMRMRGQRPMYNVPCGMMTGPGHSALVTGHWSLITPTCHWSLVSGVNEEQ
jgi:hypothetical protein